MKYAYILVEVSADTEQELRAGVSKARKALHALHPGVYMADLPYYEQGGPKYASRAGQSRSVQRLTNRWPDFRAIFDSLPWRQ